MNDASYSGRPWVAIASYDPRFFRICEHYLACLDGSGIRCETFQSGQELLALTCDVRELDSLYRPENGVRPCAPRLSSLSSLLLDLKSLLASSPRPNAGSVNRLLASWGAPSQMVGVVYLRESVCLALQYDSHFAIRKDILQEVGDWHTITDEAVDSGIRRLIDALDRKKAPAWLSFRQRHHLPQGSKLTTGTFIYEVRDELLSPPPAPNAPSEGEPQPDEREPQPAACV